MSIQTEAQQHEMQLTQTYPSGAEEWFCSTCGRRFVMQWPPAYRKIILEAGDEYAAHSGGKGGLQLGSPQVRRGEGEPLVSNELREAIEDALEDIDFDNWTDPAEQ